MLPNGWQRVSLLGAVAPPGLARQGGTGMATHQLVLCRAHCHIILPQWVSHPLHCSGEGVVPLLLKLSNTGWQDGLVAVAVMAAGGKWVWRAKLKGR